MSMRVPGGSVSGGRPLFDVQPLVAASFPKIEVVPPSPAMPSRPGFGARPLPNFTASVPAPHTITQKKDEHMRSLEMQLKQVMEMLGVEHKQQTDSVRDQAEQQIRGFQLSVEQQVKRAELALNQQYSERMMLTQQAAEAQRADIERQAATLVLQYNQCQTQDAFLQQNQTIEGQYAEAQAKLAADMQALGPPARMFSGPALAAMGHTPTAPVATGVYQAPVYQSPSLPGTPQTSFVPPVALPGTPQRPVRMVNCPSFTGAGPTLMVPVATGAYQSPSLPGTPQTSFVPPVALPGNPQGPIVPTPPRVAVPAVSQRFAQRVPAPSVPQRLQSRRR